MSTMIKNEKKAMLVLSAVSYCGYNLALAQPLHSAVARNTINGFLLDLSSECGEWHVIWGPASFRSISPCFDDVCMYVAEGEAKPGERVLAIIIRGTNPISVYDWLFGDLLVKTTVAWNYGEKPRRADAKLSSSTAIGLGILQHLRWKEETSVPGQTALPGSSINLVEVLHGRLSSSGFSALLFTAKQKLQDFKLPLPVIAELRSDEIPEGSDLVSFLKANLSGIKSATVYVAGHSKGGALSSALAALLADTRPAWQPFGAEIELIGYSFAAPTAGNKDFAEHLVETLKGKWHRVVNELDIVPYVWHSEGIQRIAGLYRLSLLEESVLDNLVKQIARDVRSLNYAQPGSAEPAGNLQARGQPSTAPFVAQIIHHHLDGYLEQAGLIDKVNTAQLLAPLL